MVFTIALIAVAVLLLAAVPGWILIKRGMVSEGSISDFSKVLLFVVQPCLAVYSFLGLEFSWELLGRLGIFALLTAAIILIMLGAAFLVLRKKYDSAIYRIMTIATTFSNCAFFGIPIIEALIPDGSPELIAYTTVFAVVMNIAGWTLGAAIIARNTSYMSLRKIVLNPATLGLVAALIVFVFEIPFHPSLENIVTVTGKMATPLSMIIMGMRLGTVKLTSLFTNAKVYATIAVKQLVMPLVAFLLLLPLPIPTETKQAFFIISACPVASVVLNFAEILGEGQREAANTVLLGTILSVVTLPVMMLMMPLL